MLVTDNLRTHVPAFNKQEWKIMLAIFIGVFIILFSGRATQVYDSQFLFLLSYTIYHDKSLNLRPYLDHPTLRPSVEKLMPASVLEKKVKGKVEWRYHYPNINAILSIPYVYLMDKLGYRIVAGDPLRWWLNNETYLQKIYCAFLISIYSLFLYRLARLWMIPRLAIFTIIILVFGSSLSSVLSRALWTDTYANLFLIIAIYHLAGAYKNKIDYQLKILVPLIALSILCKPTYAIAMVMIVGWAFLLNRKKTVYMLFGASLLLIIGLLYNHLVFGNVLGNYHFGGFDGFDLSRTAGLLVSPARGMLIYWPWTILIIGLIYFVYRHLSFNERLIIYLCLIPLVMTVLMLSCFWFWHGGPGYGPRLLIPAMPGLFLIFIIVVSKYFNPIIEHSSQNQLRQINNQHQLKSIQLSKKNQTLIISSSILCIWAVMINMFGTNQNKAHDQWYRLPLNGKTFNDRMWDWSDPPFLAGYIKPERYFKYTLELDSVPSSTYGLPSTTDDVHKLIRKNLEKK